MTSFRIRVATEEDIPLLHALIESSVRVLQANDYSPTQIEGALGTVLGVDSQLIADRTYFVAIADEEKIVGCGGWSRRKTLFGSDHGPNREDAFLDPGKDPAKIRAIFVHPNWSRRGIGSRILEFCEQAAMAEGFTRFEMGSTLTGVPLYRLKGYIDIERLEVPLRNGASLPVIRMEKYISHKNLE